MEGADEIQGLRFWNGDGIVRLLEADENLNAMLLERCEPGVPLREMPEPEQDVVIARLLRRLWRKTSELHPFPPLSFMLEQWASEAKANAARWFDSGLVHHGLRLFEELSRPAEDDVVLATDLHAGNVLRAQRNAPVDLGHDRRYEPVVDTFISRLIAAATLSVGVLARIRARIIVIGRLA